MEEKTISYFDNIRNKAKPETLNNILAAIKNGDNETEIVALRKAKSESEIQYGLLKNNLPAFTPSGSFKGTHHIKNLQEYNPLIVLDIDKVGEAKVAELKAKAASVEYTYAAFISPSGDGLKILAKTDSTKITHEDIYNLLSGYYESELGIEIDKSGKNINRLCFLSFDPELYLNEESMVFQNTNTTEIPVFSENPYSVDINKVFENVISFTRKQIKFFPGNRNNFIFQLANNLNRAGIEQNTAEVLIFKEYTEPDLITEIPKTIESAYKNTEEHAIFANNYFESASSASSATPANPKTGVGTPVIPKEIYDKLPQLLKKGADAFDIEREKDIFLTGAITLLSGCFPNVQGIYDGKEVYCNLNCFVIAPPASGKGVLNLSRELVQRIHDSIKTTFEANDTIGDVILSQNSPMTLFIPADSSSAAVKRTLNKNGGVGIICETEAETLSSTFKQDWGGYTNIILKAFQHEPISYARAGDDEDVKLGEINCPKLSVCLSGIPNQVSSLIKSTEDGLFSRFIFYNFRYNKKPDFKNVFKVTGVTNLTEHFKAISEEVLQISNNVKTKTSITVKFTDKQITQYQPHFNKKLEYVHNLFGEESVSTVIRLGLIIFRIAMLLTLLRKVEKGELTEEIECEDVDFVISLKLSEIYLEHALSVLRELPGTVKLNPTARIFFEFLPKQFSYTEAINIGKIFIGISVRTVTNYLDELKDIKWLKQPKKNGPYLKSDLQ